MVEEMLQGNNGDTVIKTDEESLKRVKAKVHSLLVGLPVSAAVGVLKRLADEIWFTSEVLPLPESDDVQEWLRQNSHLKPVENAIPYVTEYSNDEGGRITEEELKRLVKPGASIVSLKWTGLRRLVIASLENEYDKLKEVFRRLQIDPDTRESLSQDRS